MNTFDCLAERAAQAANADRLLWVTRKELIDLTENHLTDPSAPSRLGHVLRRRSTQHMTLFGVPFIVIDLPPVTA